jgi:phosphate transport system protein
MIDVQEITQLRTVLLQMWVRAETMVRQAVRSVVERDAQMGRAVIALDDDVDSMELELDRRCLSILARGTHDSDQLRFVTTVMKMVTDLERIGDLAVNVSERGFDLIIGRGVEPSPELAIMGDLVADMVRDAADAFVARDAAAAFALRARDTEVDAMNRAAFIQGKAILVAHPDQTDRALALTNISKHLERIGDHAVNLAEMVFFIVDGTDVRHRPSPVA